MSKRHNRGMYQYLESLGVLERGDHTELEAAKKAYRKDYLLKHKRAQRKSRPEFTINFSNVDGEYSRIEKSAKKHSMSVTKFIKECVRAYIANAKTYIIPDRAGLAHIEQLIAECLNEVQSIAKRKERYYFEDQKIEAIEKRITRLEEDISHFFQRPLPVGEFVRKAVDKDPALRDQILEILTNSHDSQSPNSQIQILEPIT